MQTTEKKDAVVVLGVVPIPEAKVTRIRMVRRREQRNANNVTIRKIFRILYALNQFILLLQIVLLMRLVLQVNLITTRQMYQAYIKNLTRYELNCTCDSTTHLFQTP